MTIAITNQTRNITIITIVSSTYIQLMLNNDHGMNTHSKPDQKSSGE